MSTFEEIAQEMADASWPWSPVLCFGPHVRQAIRLSEELELVKSSRSREYVDALTTERRSLYEDTRIAWFRTATLGAFERYQTVRSRLERRANELVLERQPEEVEA